MTDNRKVERDVLKGLTVWLGAGFSKPVTLIRANQTGPIPPYPYGAYTVTTTQQEQPGTYSEEGDGSFAKPVKQIWSMVVVSDDHDEAQTVALLMTDYLGQAGGTYLTDHGIVASKVGNVTNRDNMITIEYEKRQGFDFTLLLINRIETSRTEMGGQIETARLQQN